MLKKATSLALVALALAPAAALAQSAGDQQYADPLANKQDTQSQPKSNSNSQGNTGGNQTQGTSTQTPESSPAPANSAQSGERSSQLPRTGSTTPISAGVLGLVLLLSGTVVRRTASVRHGSLA